MNDIPTPKKVRARFWVSLYEPIDLLNHEPQLSVLWGAMLDGDLGHYARCFLCTGEPPLSGFLDARHEGGVLKSVNGCFCARCWPRPDLPARVRDKLIEIYEAGDLDPFPLGRLQ